MIGWVVVSLFVFFFAFVWRTICSKNIDLWISSYIVDCFAKKKNARASGNSTTHILIAIADHYEPFVGKVPYAEAIKRVDYTCQRFPELASQFTDSDDHHPKISFFYPLEDYDEAIMNSLAGICKRGFGEVEIHYHHDNDTSENLERKLNGIKECLYHNHGLLSRNTETGEIQYGFIHGNWALDNSRKDGRWCGVNDELLVLKRTGCYADFTLPSAPDETQTAIINSIYYATDDPEKPKSHNTGVEVRVGTPGSGDLLLIQGPLTLDWRRRRRLIFPSIENSDVCGTNPADMHRFRLWFKQRIHVKGRPEWIFVKLHTHSASPSNRDAIYGDKMEQFLKELQAEIENNDQLVLHFVSTREMYNITKAAENGASGDPGTYRDYLLKMNY